jgi:hypothetical protein
MNQAKGRSVTETQFNGFSGYEIEFQAEGTRVRGWVLEHTGLPLDITYRCPIGVGFSLDPEVDAMIRTIRATRA